MRKILLIKTSSLGDVVHNLPVVSDIVNALGGAAIDWAVEKSFAAIPAMHPAVRRVIPCALRHWRGSWLAPATRRAWRGFVAELRAEHYDCVIDTQGLLKSAVVAHAARGRRVGLDWKSSREPLRLFYDQVFNIPWTLHAVERNRQLAGLALGYAVAGDPRYGISAEKFEAQWMPSSPYAVFLHGTSQARKLWPEDRWIELGTRLASSGYSFVLPWGNRQEKERARRLAVVDNGVIAPQMSIEELAGTLSGARFVVGVDTGFTHLAAALAVPVVGIYGATDPLATGIRAPGHALNLGNIGRFPSCEEVVEALAGFGVLA